MSDPLHILLVEDDSSDAELVRLMLARVRDESFQVHRAASIAEAREKLLERKFDVALVDLMLTDTRGLWTLKCLRLEAPDVPLIALTGLDAEQMALDAIAAGAQDYLVKGQHDGTVLARAIRYAMERKRLENSQAQLNRDLAQALSDVKALTGMLPICVNCKSVRNDQGYWQRIEEYMHSHAGVSVSHGLCPDCANSQ